MHFLIFFNKILPLKRYKIALTTFWKKKFDKKKHWYFFVPTFQLLL
jgi:hypothetical protein